MRLSRRTRLAGVGLAVAASLVLAACGGGSDSGADDNIISSRSVEPENPLVPTNTAEVGGGNVIDQIFSGLVVYETDGKPRNEVAESIESDDNQTWTIKLKKGWKFTDGTEVKAKNFIDAWNYGALGTNAQAGSYFFDPIEGYSEVNPGVDENNKPLTPKAKTMSGLKQVDDYTFTVKLSGPQSDFPLRLGYSAYVPLPDVAFKDMEAFGKDPIGNGPYKLDGKGAWQRGKQISLVTNKDYNGYRKPKNDGITFKLYKEETAAYRDVQSGNLDITDNVPANELSKYEDATDIQPISKPGSVWQSFRINSQAKHFGFNKEGNLRRQAFSRALDRKAITDKIFFGSRTPAKDFGAPVIPGYSDKIPGSEVLTFDAAEAKRLWKQADAISKWSGTFSIAYNADSDHKAWVDAVTNQLANVLGIEAEGKPYPTFPEFQTDLGERKIPTGFRAGWQADYPSLYNYLGPLYASGAADNKGSNDNDFKNPQFDSLLEKALESDTDAGRVKNLQAAEQILFQQLPAIPLWNQNVAAAAAKGVKDVKFNWKNVPEYYLMSK